MSAVLWDTREALAPEFERRWAARLALCPHANFMMDLDCLRWDAAQGRHAIAALIDDGVRRAALVLRRERGGFACGQPWRWQVVLEGADPARPVGIDAADATWAVGEARAIAAPQPVRCYLPVAPADGAPAFAAYTTILHSIAHDDDDLLRAMHAAKRRMIRRAEREGYTVSEEHTIEQLRAFAVLAREAATQRGRASEYDPSVVPEPGQAWREWEQPWMWLLLASKDGRVASGLGDGRRPGGMLDGRKAASAPDARRDGAFALLSFEEARRGRDRGHRWINLGGDTVFKREMSGALGHTVVMHCWLAGGAAWGLPDRAEALWRRTRAGAQRVA
ncbi:MAG: hypothetical protein HYR74_07060, partial [Candidatus Eisenbacteria bacterium]|nr:hypothetical protein [Candidatus Eisenbacteria bacterium]